MKTKFNNRELAHVWAGQKQQQGSGSNMILDGASIYSYGRHFEIARWVNGVVLFNSARYSNSTAKHQNHVLRAINHATIFHVPSMTDHSANVCAYLAAVEAARGAALRAVRHADMHSNSARRAADAGAHYVEVFKKDIPVKLRAEMRRVCKLVNAGKLFTAAELAKLAAVESRRADADKKREERAAAQRLAWEAGAPARALNAEHEKALTEDKRRETPRLLEAWAAGADIDTDPLYIAGYFTPTRLRLKDGRVETSRGAQITERKARELWAGLVRGADVSGIELDNFTVTSWDGAVLIVGCHDIPRAELERMAAVLELPGALPAAAPAGV